MDQFFSLDPLDILRVGGLDEAVKKIRAEAYQTEDPGEEDPNLVVDTILREAGLSKNYQRDLRRVLAWSKLILGSKKLTIHVKFQGCSSIVKFWLEFRDVTE